jgi:protein-S-isoprenylcysteine O-methyltransferase Ste14
MASRTVARPAAAPGVASPAAGWLEELRYLVFGCAAPAALFGLLGWYNLTRLHAAMVGSDQPDSVWQFFTGPLQRALYLAFVSIPVAIYVTRPRAQRRDTGFFPRLAAFTGTTMLLVYPAFFDHGPRVGSAPGVVRAIAGTTMVLGTAFGVWGLVTLRHSFSIIPEARRVVRDGPYRFVRHPLYAAEIAVAVSLALQGDLHAWSSLVLVAFVAVQYARSGYEERLLRSAFADYDDYAKVTPRLVPFAKRPG